MLAIIPVIICQPFCIYLCRLSYTRSRPGKELLGRSSRSRDFLQWIDSLFRSRIAREWGKGERTEHCSASTGQGLLDGLVLTSTGLLCSWGTYPVSHASWAPVALAFHLAFLKGWLEQGLPDEPGYLFLFLFPYRSCSFVCSLNNNCLCT